MHGRVSFYKKNNETIIEEVSFSKLKTNPLFCKQNCQKMFTQNMFMKMSHLEKKIKIEDKCTLIGPVYQIKLAEK